MMLGLIIFIFIALIVLGKMGAFEGVDPYGVKGNQLLIDKEKYYQSPEELAEGMDRCIDWMITERNSNCRR